METLSGLLASHLIPFQSQISYLMTSNPPPITHMNSQKLIPYSYPMPTLALLNGHAFAGGLMTAMHHDYRIANPSKGYLCLNELDFGAPLKPPMSSIFREKLPAATYRKVVLEAHRFAGPEALASGLVDGLGALDEAIKFATDRKLVEKGKTGVYGVMKWEMYRESVQLLSQEGWDAEEERIRGFMEEEEKRREDGEKVAGEWKEGGKAKL
jgi:Delta3-Delta2-enoyl-CoA isomerase